MNIPNPPKTCARRQVYETLEWFNYLSAGSNIFMLRADGSRPYMKKQPRTNIKSERVILMALVGVGTAGMGEGRGMVDIVPSGGDRCFHPVNPACNTGEHSQHISIHRLYRIRDRSEQRNVDWHKRTFQNIFMG